jgi:two-component system response regulator PfeR
MTRVSSAPGKMLLCVDDSPAILEYERSLFEKLGYVVVTADSAGQGLRLATMSRFDAVLLDYGRPEINGHELAAEIKRRRPETLVVMFSGSEIPEETRQLVDAVVPKTEALAQLAPRVSQLFDRRHFRWP